MIGKLGTLLAVAFSMPAQANWTFTTSVDEMTGEIRAYAFSPRTVPTKPMRFPYKDMKSSLAFGCSEDSEWAYMNFTSRPNIRNDKVSVSGYNDIVTRIRFDDKIQKWELTQAWGASSLHFDDGQRAINQFRSSKTMLLELNWHGNENVYFRYDLSGSVEGNR